MSLPELLPPQPLAGRLWPGRPGSWLVLLHGFLADSRDWLNLAPQLQEYASVLAIDLPGHGGSATVWPSTHAGSWADWHWQRQAVLATIRAVTVEPVVLHGYSMGGRVAAQLAAEIDRENSQLIKGLILESAHPGLMDAAAISARQQQDEQWAMELLDRGMVAFALQWQRQPLFATQHNLPPAVLASQQAVRCSQLPAAMAASLRRFGTGSMPAVRRIARDYEVLSMAGSLDGAYVAHLSRWSEVAPQGRIMTVADSGHNIHLDQPDVWLTAVRGALADHASSGTLQSPQSH